MKIISKILSLALCMVIAFSSVAISAEAASIKVSPPEKVTASTTADTAKLTWSKVSKATGYRVYQKKDGKWKAVKTVKNNTYTVTDLTASESYSFAVKTYRKYGGKTYYSSKYTAVSAKTKSMGNTPAPKATTDKNSVTLKWSEVPGATGYRVYQYKDGDWVKIKSVTTNSYKVTSLKVDTTYKFKIKPYAKTSAGTVWGKTSSAVSAKTVDKTKTTFTGADIGTKEVTLNWSRVAGATGYRLYVLKDGSWSKVKTTSALSYKVTNLNSNTAYTFMVRAYKKSSGKTTWYTKSNSYTVVTNPDDSDLKPYRIEKYKAILDSSELYFKMTTIDPDLGKMPVEFARKNGNIFMKTTYDGLTMRIYYVKKTNKTYMYIDEMRMYAIVPEDEAESMDFDELIEEMAIKNVGDITVTRDVFDGKNVICESYVDTANGQTVKYYFYADELIGSETIFKNGSSDIIYISGVTTSVSDNLFTRPKRYLNVSGIFK